MRRSDELTTGLPQAQSLGAEIFPPDRRIPGDGPPKLCVKHSPMDPAQPALQRARALWQGGRPGAAEAAFRDAAAAFPQSPSALLDAAKVLGQRGDLAAASVLLQQAMELPDRPAGLPFQAAQAWRMILREAEALALLEPYVRGAGARQAHAHLELALLCERQRQYERAATAARAALRAQPGLPEAQVILARLALRGGERSRGEEVLRTLLRRERIDPFTRLQAGAALAQSLAEAGDTPAALVILAKVKEPFRASTAGLAERGRRALRQAGELVASLTAADFRDWWAAPDDGPRFAQLCGYPRTGSTLLEQVLDAHPDVLTVEEREIFARDIQSCLWKREEETTRPTPAVLHAIPPDHLQRLRTTYRQGLEGSVGSAAGNRWLLDKNPLHTLALPALFRLLPGLRVIVALRDPRDILVSCYFQAPPPNPISALWLDRDEAAAHLAGVLELWAQIRERLPAEAWCEVRYEDLVADWRGQAARALELLGLGWSSQVEAYREHAAQKTLRTPGGHAVLEPITPRAQGRWRECARWLEPVLPTLAPALQRWGYA